MNSLTFFKRFGQSSNPKISLLIPFRSDGAYREIVFKWVVKYWKHQLPNSEIVIGTSKSKIFSKTEALNDAVQKSHGKVLVLLDADAYIDGSVIEKCADKILENLENHLWYIPYKRMYRLNDQMTTLVLDSQPTNALQLPESPPIEILDDYGKVVTVAHRYGAMIMMFAREAYDVLGCFDERFQGWGGEDVALMKALDTLYGKHKLANKSLYHLWHPKIGTDHKSRMWSGQSQVQPNNKLTIRYFKANRNPSLMRTLVQEAKDYKGI